MVVFSNLFGVEVGVFVWKIYFHFWPPGPRKHKDFMLVVVDLIVVIDDIDDKWVPFSALSVIILLLL